MKLEAELCILKDTFVTQNKQSEAHMNRLASRIGRNDQTIHEFYEQNGGSTVKRTSQPAYRPAINMGGLPPFRRILTPPSQDVFIAARKGI